MDPENCACYEAKPVERFILLLFSENTQSTFGHSRIGGKEDLKLNSNSFILKSKIIFFRENECKTVQVCFQF